MPEVTFDLIRQARQRVAEMDPDERPSRNRWSMTERDKEVLLMILDDAAAIYEARKEEAEANNEHFRKNYK